MSGHLPRKFCEVIYEPTQLEKFERTVLYFTVAGCGFQTMESAVPTDGQLGGTPYSH